MSEEFHITSINDTLKFDDEQFARFLVDFVAWHQFMRLAQAEGAESRGMIWVDDGCMGEVNSIELEIKETGEKLSIGLRASDTIGGQHER